MITQDQYDDMRRERDEWRASCAQYHKANESLDKDRSAMMAAIRRLLSSANPHPKEHPTMHEAWQAARLLLSENVLAHPLGGVVVNSNEVKEDSSHE